MGHFEDEEARAHEWEKSDREQKAEMDEMWEKFTQERDEEEQLKSHPDHPGRDCPCRDCNEAMLDAADMLMDELREERLGDD